MIRSGGDSSDAAGRRGRRGRRKALALARARRPLAALRRVLSRAGRAIWTRGPVILVAGGTLFLIAMVVFIFVVPLPPPVVPVATRVFDRNGALLGSLFSQNRIPVRLTEVPDLLKEGIVALEDERFYAHHGIDLVGLGRAAVRNLRAGQIVEGGSTITAQVARTLYLTQELTVTRKVLEALLSLKLERAYTKEEILELYLNQIYMGSGAYGIEVASLTYFGKSVKDLTVAQLAMIAGLPKGPELYSPYNNPERAKKRRDFILDFWGGKGLLDANNVAAAKAEPLTLSSAGPPALVGPYFMEYVVTLFKEAQSQGAKLPSLAELYTGGYRIYTTVDLAMQRAADQVVKDWAPKGQEDATGVTQPQVALVAMDPTNGYILAMVGGRSWAETKLNRAVPRGLGTEGMRRQPGSAFKPFLYTAVLDSGFPLLSTQTCEPVDFPSGSGERYSPTDYGANPYHYRDLTIREAVRISDNVVAVKWLAQIGPAREKQFAQRMGIDAPLTGDLSLALGSSEVSVLEMARGFSTLASGGLRVQPQALLRLEDRYGRVLYDPGRTTTLGAGPRPERAIDERVAFLMNDLLKEPFRSGGTATHLLRYFSRPVAGKTGTTDKQFDTWFVGYTPQVVCAVWVGNDQPARLAGYGGTLAGPIWGNFMAAAHAKLPVKDFTEPAGIVRLEICSETGLLPNLTCPRVEEMFIEGTQPREPDTTIHGLPFPFPGWGDSPGDGTTDAAPPDAGSDEAAGD